MERAEAEAILDGERETAVALLMRVGELIEANRRLEARVAELEQRLNRSSRNSSLPPSQDPPLAPPRPGKPGSGRRRGGQPGHEGTNRPLLPLERVDEVVEHWPDRCAACAHGGAFGPRLQAAVATLAVRNRVSRRDTVELMRELFGVELSTGSIDAIVQRAGEALAQPQARLQDQIRSAAAVNIDETGWRLRGGKRTLWAALTTTAAVFRIAPDRPEREAKALLGEEFAGIASSDRWWAYDYLDPARRQLCWAHLVRDFTAHGDGLAAQQEFGEAGLAIAACLFEAWEEFRRDCDRAHLSARIAPLKQELRALLEQAARTSTKTNYQRLFATNLLKRWPALWTFTEVDGVEPTNNHAERGLRGAVIYRKLSLGSQSEGGQRTIERLLSASITCRLQQRSLFAYLTDVLSTSIRGDPIPLLT